MTDWELLQAYARQKSAAAFQELVRRHARLVYGSARQRVGDAHAAEDITQSVFLALATKAHTLPAHTILTGWLYRVTRYTAIDYLRREQHRREREMTAHETQQLDSQPDPVAGALWQEISPHLPAALDGLSDTDRNAVLLRFYQQNSYAEIAEALRVSPDSARKRVDRAVDRLRRFLGGKGIRASAGGLVAALGAGTAEAVPAAVIEQAAQAALAAGVSGTMSWITTGGIAIMSTKLKIAAGAAIVCLLVGGAAVVVLLPAWQDSSLKIAPPASQPTPARPVRLPVIPAQPAAAGASAEEVPYVPRPVFASMSEFEAVSQRAFMMEPGAGQLAALRRELGMAITENTYRRALILYGNDNVPKRLSQAIVEAWMESNPRAAVKWMYEIPPKQSAGRRLLAEWLDRDREAALLFAREFLPPGELAAAEKRLEYLAKNEQYQLIKAGQFDELVRRAEQTADPTQRGMSIHSAVLAWARKDARAAAAYALALPSGETSGWQTPGYVRQQALRKTLETWTITDADAALTWAQGLTDSADKTLALTAVLPGWARQHPDQAIDLSQVPEREQLGVITTVAQDWAMRDPAAAMRYALSLSEGESRSYTISSVSQIWGKKDPATATQWALAQPAGQTRDTTLGQIAEAVCGYDVARAETLAEAIQDGNLRQNTLQEMVRVTLRAQTVDQALRLAGKLPQVNDSVVSTWTAWIPDNPAAIAAFRTWFEQAHAAGRITYPKYPNPENTDPAIVANWERQATENAYRNIINTLDQAAANAGK